MTTLSPPNKTPLSSSLRFNISTSACKIWSIPTFSATSILHLLQHLLGPKVHLEVNLASEIDSLSIKTDFATVKMESLILLTTMMLAMAFGSPVVSIPSLHLAARTNNTLIAASSPLLFKFNPGIVNAMCTGVYATKISVQYTTDDFTLSDDCRDFLNLIGGVKAKTDVDVVIVCSGTQPTGTGEDENKLKVMFFVTGMSLADDTIKGTQWIDVLLEATSIPKDKVVSTPALVGVNVNDKDGFTINQLTC